MKIEQVAYVLCKQLHRTSCEIMGREVAEIVAQHSIGAAVAGLASGWVPAGGQAIATTIAVGFIWGMYFRISSKIGLPFNKHILKTLATAIGTNLVVAVGSEILAMVAAFGLSFIPVIGGMASATIMAAVTYSLTWTSGLIYLKVLSKFAERNVDFNSITADDLKSMARDVMDSENLKEMMKDAKEQFKKAKSAGMIRKGMQTVDPMKDEA